MVKGSLYSNVVSALNIFKEAGHLMMRFNTALHSSTKSVMSYTSALTTVSNLNLTIFDTFRRNLRGLSRSLGTHSKKVDEINRKLKDVLKNEGIPVVVQSIGQTTPALQQKTQPKRTQKPKKLTQQQQDTTEPSRAMTVALWFYRHSPRVIKNAGKKFYEFVKNNDKMFKGFKKTLSSFLMLSVVSYLMELLDAINPFKPLLQALTDIFSVYGEILSTAFIPIIKKLYEVMLSPEVIDGLTKFASSIADALDWLMNLGSAFKLFKRDTKDLQENTQATSTAVKALSVVLAFLKWSFGANLGDFKEYFGKIRDVLKSITSYTYVVTFLDTLKNVLFGPAGFFVSLADFVNGLIEWINKTLKTNISTISFKPTGDIVALASGGIVVRPTLALVGERGPEAVVPLDQLDETARSITVNVYGSITDDKIFEMSREIWRKRL